MNQRTYLFEVVYVSYVLNVPLGSINLSASYPARTLPKDSLRSYSYSSFSFGRGQYSYYSTLVLVRVRAGSKSPEE